MSAQLSPVPGQTEGGRKAFLEWTSRNLFSYFSLTSGGNVNYHKNVHHPILTLPDGIGETQAVFKANQYDFLLIEYPGMFSSRGKEGLFWKVREEGTTLRDYPQEYLVVIGDEKSLLL